MSDYTKQNLKEVENAAPKFDMPSEIEARFARRAIGGETLGLSHITLAPGFRIPFGHKHANQEEVYVIVAGGGRVMVGEDERELRAWDVLRVGPDTMRAFEAGPDGMEWLAFGGPIAEESDAEIVPGWWGD